MLRLSYTSCPISSSLIGLVCLKFSIVSDPYGFKMPSWSFLESGVLSPGFVIPCVYLTLPVRGDTMAKVHEGESYRIPMTRLGNVNESELLDIWNSEAYKKFREPFAGRKTICGNAGFGMTDDGGFEEIDAETFSALSRHPLPKVCHGCYKALGI